MISLGLYWTGCHLSIHLTGRFSGNHRPFGTWGTEVGAQRVHLCTQQWGVARPPCPHPGTGQEVGCNLFEAVESRHLENPRVKYCARLTVGSLGPLGGSRWDWRKRPREEVAQARISTVSSATPGPLGPVPGGGLTLSLSRCPSALHILQL